MRAWLALFAILQVGCGAVLTTDRREYAAGDTVKLTLANRGSHPLGYNLCGLWLQRRDGASWTTVPTDERTCLAVLYVLRVGFIAHTASSLPAQLAAGEYRLAARADWEPLYFFRWRLDRAGGKVDLVSNVFRVR